MYRLLLLLFLPLHLFSQNTEEKLNEYKNYSKDEFLYIHTSQAFYEPGTGIYGTIWVFDASDKSLENATNLVEIELLNPSGVSIYNYKLNTFKGSVSFSFSIPNVSGIYTIKARLLNGGKTFEKPFISKQIQVQKVKATNLMLNVSADKPIYLFGDSVTLKLQGLTAMKFVPASTRIEYALYIDGYINTSGFVMTDSDGNAVLGLRLPKDVDIRSAMVHFNMDVDGLSCSNIKIIQLPGTGNHVKFFPEGGQMLEGQPSRVAFKLRDKNGVAKMGKGLLVDVRDGVIAPVATEHEGMGVFTFTPVKGHRYQLLIMDSDNQVDTFEIKNIQSSGFVINAHQIKDTGIIVEFRGKIQKAKLFVRMADNLVKKVDLNLDSFHKVVIPISHLPMGIVQLTVLDSMWQVLGERLLFVNYNKQLRISYSFNKERYETNEEVVLNIEAKDFNGKPVQGMSAISVYQNDLYLASDPNQANAMSELYLSQELKNEIEHPAYYFKKENASSLAHLDLLMMCSESVRLPYWALDSALHKLKLQASVNQKFVVRGRIFDRKNFVDVDFYYPLTQLICLNNGQQFSVDSNGYFTIVGIPNDADLNFKVKAPGQHGHWFTVKPWLLKSDILSDKNIQWYIEEDVDSLSLYAKQNWSKLVDKNVQVDESFSKVRDSKQEIVAQLNKEQVFQNARIPGASHGQYVDGVRVNSSNLEHNQRAGFRGVTGFAGLIGYTSIYDYPENASGLVNVSKSQSMERSYIYPASYSGYNRSTFNSRKSLIVSEKYIDDYSYYYWPSTSLFTNYNDPYEFVQDDNGRSIYIDTSRNSNLLNYYNNYYRGYNNPSANKKLCYFYRVELDKSGKAQIRFRNSALTGVYRCNAIVAGAGMVSEQDTVYSVSNNVLFEFNMPEQVWKNEIIFPELKLKNTSNTRQLVNVEFRYGGRDIEFEVKLDSLSTFDTTFKLDVSNYSYIRYTLDLGYSKNYDKQIGAVIINQPKLYESFVFNGSKAASIDTFYIPDNVNINKDLRVSLSVQSDVNVIIDDMAKGMLRMPHGCFEQVSSTNYPNILAYKLLMQNKKYDEAKMDSYKEYIIAGYNKMVAYETSKGGFEWYGGLPPHEGLTAYGLMQFLEMRQIGIDVDPVMFKRVSKWLYGRFSSNGSIKQSEGKYGFSSQNNLVVTTYATWVLSQIKGFDLKQQISYIDKNMQQNMDPYIVAFLSDIYKMHGDTLKSNFWTNQLVLTCQQGLDELTCLNTLTNSYGIGKEIELYGVVASHLIQNGKHNELVYALIQRIMKFRTANGHFPSTQSTIWGMKALVLWMNTINSQKSGNPLLINVNGKEFSLPLISNYDLKYPFELKHGMNIISTKGLNSDMFYQLMFEWLIPDADKASEQLKISTFIAKDSFKVGELVPLKIHISNLQPKVLDQVVAVINLPSGCNANPEQLRIMKENGSIDYYEIVGNKVHLYFRHLDSLETKIVIIPYTPGVKGHLIQPEIIVYPYYYPEMVANTRMFGLKID